MEGISLGGILREVFWVCLFSFLGFGEGVIWCGDGCWEGLFGYFFRFYWLVYVVGLVKVCFFFFGGLLWGARVVGEVILFLF